LKEIQCDIKLPVLSLLHDDSLSESEIPANFESYNRLKISHL
jgi:hypothetical protein